MYLNNSSFQHFYNNKQQQQQQQSAIACVHQSHWDGVVKSVTIIINPDWEENHTIVAFVKEGIW